MFIGIDDTDIPGSPGTGKLARRLASQLEAHGVGRSLGVTRHQLLIHPSIPYTSHNSAACLELETAQGPRSVLQFCRHFLVAQSIPGSDPGLCVLVGARATGELIEFGRAGRGTILDVEGAQAAAGESGALVATIGGSGLGVIGAVAAVGLRASGDDGRFIGLDGIRELGGIVSVGEIKRKTAISSIVSPDSAELADDATVDTQDWLRPRLIRGRAVLMTEPHPRIPGGWVSVDRSNKSNLSSQHS
jgi:hypothetical protein